MWTSTISNDAVAAANDNRRRAPCANRTRFPAGTSARIFRRARSPLTAGRADTKDWRLIFRPEGRRFIEPLMGWVGTADPLGGLELRFPTLESAIRYARRQGLDFTIESAPVPTVPAALHQNPAPAVLGEQAA